jgi:hypothetical protein
VGVVMTFKSIGPKCRASTSCIEASAASTPSPSRLTHLLALATIFSISAVSSVGRLDAERPVA